MTLSARQIGDGPSELTRLRRENARLVAVLKGIAEYCSGDSGTLRAIQRLAAIRNTADQAVRAHGKSENISK